MKQFLGRYTAVIITTVVFLVLVIGVLGVNFNLSFQTEANAEVVNIAGRQRMLSQRVAKSLGNVKSRYIGNEPYQDQLSELKAASGLFNRTLTAFKEGGTTVSTTSGESILQPVNGVAGVAAVSEALDIWMPLYTSLLSLIQELESTKVISSEITATGSVQHKAVVEQLVATQLYMDQRINDLLKLMNDLTNYNEGLANKAANRSRLIQTVGIIASLVCFAVIMFLIFGQLRRADATAAVARNETRQIFSTVDQGLFLINQDMSLGGQHSKALETIFSTTSFEGRDFKNFVSELVSTSDLEKVVRYLNLLFDPHKKQKLLKDLNPLNELAIQVEQGGHLVNKYLNFSFSRVMSNGEITGVLSSVSDISREIKLAKDLETESQKNEQQLEMISALLGADAELLPQFIDQSNQTYDEINKILRDPAKSTQDFKDKADSILSLIHKIKGESATFGLSVITDICHRFENQVESLVSKPRLSGDDFISLTIMLEELITTNEKVSLVYSNVLTKVNATSASNQTNKNEPDRSNEQLHSLAHKLATRQNKAVQIRLAGFDSEAIPANQKLDILSLSTQLLRNAISHGIEKPEQRVKNGKSTIGTITLSLYNQESDNFCLVCEDDGQGMDFKKLTEKAIDAGLINENEKHQVTHARIVNLVLSNKLSSKDDIDEDSGRGVGLSVVSQIISKLNGKISLKTKRAEGTRFTISFPNQLAHLNKTPMEVTKSA